MLRVVCFLSLILVLPGAAAEAETAKLTALIVDGHNNHDWRVSTPIIRRALEASGRFTVEVATQTHQQVARISRGFLIALSQVHQSPRLKQSCYASCRVNTRQHRLHECTGVKRVVVQGSVSLAGRGLL